MAPVLCTAGNNGRAGGVGQAGAAAAVQHGVLFLTFLSPTACRSGGLAAQDREDRAAAGAVGGGVPRVQDLPPPDVGAGRAGDRVPPVREGLDRAVGFLVGFRPAQPDMHTVGAVQGDVGEGERGEFGAAVRAGEPHQQQRGVAAGGHPRRPAARLRGQRCQQHPDVVQ